MLSEWLSSYSFFLLEVFIPWYSFLGVFYTSLHVDPTLVFMTFSLHWHLFIILYEVTRQSQATESQGQTLWAPRIVWTRAKPQTTEHDMKALHILANDGLTQYRLDFPFLFIHPSSPLLNLDSPIRHHSGRECIGLHCFNSLRSPRISLCWSAYLSICVKPGKKNANSARRNWACPYLNTIRLAVAPGLGLFCCWQPRRCVFC